MTQTVDVEAVRAQMAQYVDNYRVRYETAKGDYEAKDAALQAVDGSDPRRALPARREAMAAKDAMEAAKKDWDAARQFADKEIAKAEKQAMKEARKEERAAEKEAKREVRKESGEKSVGAKVVDGAVMAAGVGVAATGAVLYLGAKGAKKVGEAGIRKLNDGRLALNNTGSHIAMSFAKYILGYEGSSLPTDPSRRNWDPAVKKAKQTGNTHDPAYQPSFV